MNSVSVEPFISQSQHSLLQLYMHIYLFAELKILQPWPHWDLAVLGFMALPVFEPLQEVDLKHLFENSLAASFSIC